MDGENSLNDIENRRASFFKKVKDVDKAVFEFYESFGLEFEGFNLKYYGFINEAHTFVVRYGYKGKKFTYIYAPDLQTAKKHLPLIVQDTIYEIRKVS